MKLSALLTAALLAAGCAVPAEDPAGYEEARERLAVALEAAREASAESGSACAGCTEPHLDRALSDLSDPLSAIRSEAGPSGAGTVWLSHPGRFWTMTFGADGGLIGLTLSPHPTMGHPGL